MNHFSMAFPPTKYLAQFNISCESSQPPACFPAPGSALRPDSVWGKRKPASRQDLPIIRAPPLPSKPPFLPLALPSYRAPVGKRGLRLLPKSPRKASKLLLRCLAPAIAQICRLRASDSEWTWEKPEVTPPSSWLCSSPSHPSRRARSAHRDHAGFFFFFFLE